MVCEESAPRVVTEQLMRSFDQMAPVRFEDTLTSIARPKARATRSTRSLTPPASSPISRCPAFFCSQTPGSTIVAPRFENPPRILSSPRRSASTRATPPFCIGNVAPSRAQHVGRDFQRVLRFGGKQDQVKLVSLSVVLNCGNVYIVCPHLSSDAGHSQARSAQCLRGIGIASRKPDGQSCADGTRRNCSAQRAEAHYQYLHFEASKMPAMRLNPAQFRLAPIEPRPRRQNRVVCRHVCASPRTGRGLDIRYRVW